MIRIRWEGLKETMPVDGVFRTPNAVDRVPKDRADGYVKSGLAVYADLAPNPEPNAPSESPTRRPAEIPAGEPPMIATPKPESPNPSASIPLSPSNPPAAPAKNNVNETDNAETPAGDGKNRRPRARAGNRIVVCYAVLNAAEYIASSLDSVYALADRIVVVEGGTADQIAAGLADADGGSVDNTAAEVESVPDPVEKIRLVRGEWDSHAAMRRAAARFLRAGDVALFLDAEDVLLDDAAERLRTLFREHAAVQFPVIRLWNDFDTQGVGGPWETLPSVRALRWEAGLRVGDDLALRRADGARAGAPDSPDTFRVDAPLAVNYAWVKPLAAINSAIAEWRKTDARVRANYVRDVFLAWRKDKTAATETHPLGGGGAEAFAGPHPTPVALRRERGLLGGDGW